MNDDAVLASMTIPTHKDVRIRPSRLFTIIIGGIEEDSKIITLAFS